MQSFLSALFTPEVLGLVLLAAVGWFIFLLLRPREQDAAEEFWLAFNQKHLESNKPSPEIRNGQDMSRAEGR